jgi:hypothetical protein
MSRREERSDRKLIDVGEIGEFSSVNMYEMALLL